jgi:C-terminal processing protease CtpA/Prc
MIKRSFLALLFVLPLLAADAVPGWIGIGYLYKRTDNRGWMLIQHLDPSGPAAKGGLRVQDIVTHIDGKPLTVPDQYAMMTVLRSVKPGQKLRLTVRRGDRTLPVVITAAKMTAQQERMWRESLEYESGRRR